ncbi:T6SS effector BTH_I2691 family protein [Halomonas binhaiensis]|uniref:Toxin VasX N-terminal region domain-containing protein n=1 Tax=Halomonas binhaiensis TaxID=2562282 RepID=A0A5C1NI17_9GAMM|nr:T6SS effector BTH_I2691 family protein [Halomonas binhaiensis]QEM81715.1 hypothetical protein E4T21_09270 [Halomonas binhaiensis]
MSEADNKTIAECPYCQKRGLPILPLRYAVTRTDRGNGEPAGPALSEPFGDGVTDIALPEGQAYTLRLVRGGYLYVFNETRGSWSGYVVTEKGYLFPYVTEIKHDVLLRLDPNKAQGGIDSRLQPPTQDEEFTCTSNPEHHYPGRCITIPNAEQADNIYLAFSDTAWTKRVWKEYAANAQVDESGTKRRDHMRKLSLAEWRGGSAKHAAPMAELAERVAEANYQWMSPNLPPVTLMRSDLYQLISPFGHSPALIHGMDSQVEGLVAWAEEQAEPLDMPPVMVALDDPVGIATELNELAKIRANEWAEEPERKKKHQSALMIGVLRQAVENGAEHQESEQRKALMAAWGTFFPGHSGMMAAGAPSLSYLNARVERAGRINESELEAIHANAWEKYLDRYDEEARNTYLNETYPAELADFEGSVIRPLDEAYLAWMKGESLKKSLLCNFDRQDVESGIAYTLALYSMLLDASGRKPVFDFLKECAQSNPLDSAAFIVRGLVFNQDDLAEQWVEAANQAYEPEGGWDGMASHLYGTFKDKLVKALGNNIQDAMTNLSRYGYELSAVFVHHLKRLYDLDTGRLIGSEREFRMVAILGVMAKHDAPNHRLVSVRTEPTRLQTLSIMQRTTAAMSEEGRWQMAPSEELRGLFDPVNSERYPYQGLLLVEDIQATRLEMSGTLSPEQFDRQMQTSMRMQSNLEAGGNLVGAILTIVTIKSAWEKLGKDPSFKNKLGLGSGLAALAGGLLESAGAAARNIKWGATRLAKPLSFGTTRIMTRAAALGFIGKLVGTVGAVISGALAFWDGVDNRQISPGYGGTMMVLGGGMVLAGFVMLFAAPAIALGAFVLSLVLAFFMFVAGFIKPDDIEKWLDRTIEFGQNKAGDRFRNIIKQREALEAIGQKDGD